MTIEWIADTCTDQAAFYGGQEWCKLSRPSIMLLPRHALKSCPLIWLATSDESPRLHFTGEAKSRIAMLCPGGKCTPFALSLGPPSTGLAPPYVDPGDKLHVTYRQTQRQIHFHAVCVETFIALFQACLPGFTALSDLVEAPEGSGLSQFLMFDTVDAEDGSACSADAVKLCRHVVAVLRAAYHLSPDEGESGPPLYGERECLHQYRPVLARVQKPPVRFCFRFRVCFLSFYLLSYWLTTLIRTVDKTHLHVRSIPESASHKSRLPAASQGYQRTSYDEARTSD